MPPVMTWRHSSLIFLCRLAWGATAFGQTVPALSVDAAANRKPISPDIYGIDYYASNGMQNVARVGVMRWGGDGTNRYNWQLDTYNSASDYYFEDYAYGDAGYPHQSYFDYFIEQGLTSGTKRLGTVSLLGWLPNTRNNVCSFSVAKYGAQQMVDPYHTDCGNGYLTNGTQITNNDPHDCCDQYGPSFTTQWIQQIISTYGTAAQGGVQIWNLDNEPEWWFKVHMDIHPVPATYDEMWNEGKTYAQTIKAADPTALVTGPVSAGWSGYFYSATDFVAGWSVAPYMFYDNPVDRNAHGGVPFVEWYLQQMAAYEQQSGQRLLDYVDIHAYIAPNTISFGSAGDPATDQLRLTSTREFWDPNYIPPPGPGATVSPTPDAGYPNGEAPYLVPRMLQWVANDYPGTKTAITEYNWGALNDITGAIAQADILGIFGAYGLDLGTLWAPPEPTDPGAFSFLLYLNYDGKGNQFGETSVSATSGDPDDISIFAAQRSDNALTIVLLNKTTSAANAPVSIANFQAAGTAEVWQYSSANLSAIQNAGNVPVSSSGFTVSLPARSMTMVVIPAVPAGPTPVIGGIGNSASYNQTALSPGEMMVLFGTNIGPAALVGTAVTPDGNYLATEIGNTRVLVNGIPAPMVYASAGQTAALVPYEAALGSTAWVEVELAGVRSAPFQMAMAAAVPALFSHDGSGGGQGAILNQDLSLNSSTNPAARGSIVVLYATGEGQTMPPGVDGRLSTSIVPAPAGACSVTIGGQPATVLYCGEAPDYTSGFLQVNVTVPTGISAGNAPVTLSIGGASSSAAVTVSLK